jgi:hypothetical protein
VRTLVVAIHAGTEQLACAHIAESEGEAAAVVEEAEALGPVWTFELTDEPLQWWATDGGVVR